MRSLTILRQLLTRCLLGLGTPGAAIHEATVAILGDAEGYWIGCTQFPQGFPLTDDHSATSPDQPVLQDSQSLFRGQGCIQGGSHGSFWPRAQLHAGQLTNEGENHSGPQRRDVQANY